MFKRQTSGSVVCPKCGRLVGVNDERCFGCGKWNPALWGYAPILGRLGRDLGFIELVFGGCSLLFLLTIAANFENFTLFSLISFSGPGFGEALLKLGASGSFPVFTLGRWWTVLSAAWLHGGLIHIGFNMMVLRQLGPMMLEAFGAARTVIIYTVSGIAGFVLTAVVNQLTELLGAPVTVGASGAILGLAGALIYYGGRAGAGHLRSSLIQWVIGLFVIGFLIGFVDNFAHAGGLAGGYVMARLLDPLREEKPGHTIAALACLLLHLASIVASVVLWAF